MRCRDCQALEYDPRRKEYRCSLTGAQVTVDHDASMPDLSSRDERSIRTRGDDDTALCPGTLDQLLHEHGSRKYALGILRQVDARGKLADLMALYPERTQLKLQALMLEALTTMEATA